MDFLAILTEATCGEACWSAREDVCRCSCGGKNHGALRTADGVRPQRTSKIDGYVYQLAAVQNADDLENGGTSLYMQARTINESAPRKSIGTYTYCWSERDKGAPARLKPASKDQVERWPELASYRHLLAGPDAGWNWYRHQPYLLWTRQS